MLKELRLLWRLRTLYKEIKTMNTNALVKMLITAAIAAASVVGGSYVANDPISITAAINAALVAALAYLKQSPVQK